MSVEIHCVRTGNSKIRVRIAAFIDDKGQRYLNAYNNNWNCQFPNRLREDNKRYLVPSANVKLRTTRTGANFYHVSDRGITELASTTSVQADGALNHTQASEMQVTPDHIFETSLECVVCMDTESTIVFSPCGHLCSCEACGCQLRKCCICRSAIVAMIKK